MLILQGVKETQAFQAADPFGTGKIVGLVSTIEPLEFLSLKFDDERTFGSVVDGFDGIGGAVASPASKTQSAVSAARTQTRTDSPVRWTRRMLGTCPALGGHPCHLARFKGGPLRVLFTRPRSNVSDC